MRFDPVTLVEKAYKPQPDAQAWLDAIAADVIAAIGEDWVGGAAYLAAPPEPPSHVVPVCREGALVSDDLNSTLVNATTRRTAGRLPVAGIASLLELDLRVPMEIAESSPVPVGDAATLWTHGGHGRLAVFSNVTSSRLRLDNPMRCLWQRIAIHLGSACRLAGRASSPEEADVEAVIDPSGHVVHAEGAAEDEHARALLRAAAERMDRARTSSGREDPFAALELWRGLIAGRWSLVDHFDSDGRRYILARHNATSSDAPPTLSRRQQQVAFYASVGWSNQEIGYQLGLAENTVSAHLGRSLEAMGIASRSELVRLSTDVAVSAMHTLGD